ncbi:MAG: PD-(D/E)XK nuclease family protein [Planctomycetota bacterium]|nr:PD-(D/E)XK nuclease family protein [Planctomycetota bacterium]
MRTEVIPSGFVEQLIGSEPYQQLLTRKPPFDLFRIVGKLTENPSSRALAYLLDSSRDHGLGTLFFEALIREILSDAKDEDVRSLLQRFLDVKGTETECRTEWCTDERRRVDVLVRVLDRHRLPAGVLGIENKHLTSDEQDKQIADYQRALVQCFPENIPRLLIFLTPGARRSRTAEEVGGCPHIGCSYRTVSAALRSCVSRLHGPVAVFVSSLADHLVSRLESGAEMDNDVKAVVRDLYKNPNHRRVIRLIQKHMPYFGTLLPWIEQRVLTEEVSDIPFAVYIWPKEKDRRHLQQVYFEPTELRPWTRPHGFRLYYVLHADHKALDWHTPDLGDRVFVQLLASCKKPTGRQAVKRMKLADVFPSSVGLRALEKKWYPLWSAGTYTLQDFDTDDVQGCSRLLIDAIRSTYPIIKTTLEQRCRPDRSIVE